MNQYFLYAVVSFGIGVFNLYGATRLDNKVWGLNLVVGVACIMAAALELFIGFRA